MFKTSGLIMLKFPIWIDFEVPYGDASIWRVDIALKLVT